MAKLDQFRFYVAITPQEELAVVGFCTLCGNTMTLQSSQSGGAPFSTEYWLKQHQCYQRIVSIPGKPE